MMIKTLYDITKQALGEYPQDELNRKDFLLGDYPAQPILIVD